MYRPPGHTPATMEDFRSSGWESACKTGDFSYFSRSHDLCIAAVDALKAGEPSRSRVLWLLGDACAMRLDSENLNTPFGEIPRERGKRFRLEDFSTSDLELFEAVSAEIHDALLRARVSDILWIRHRRHFFALAAIEAYRQAPIRGDAWMLEDAKNCWRRAIVLARQVKGPGRTLLLELEADLLAASLEEVNEGEMFPSRVETLLDFGLAKEKWASIGEGLVKRAARIGAAPGGDVRYLSSRACLSLAKRCFNAVKNFERIADIDCQIASLWAEEARARIAGPHPSYIIAADFFSQATRALLVVPKALRAMRGVDELLNAYRSAQKDAASRSMEEFAPMRGQPIDLSEERKGAADSIKGQGFLEALHALALCWSLASRKSTEEETRKQMREFVFTRLFGTAKLADDGRVIAKGPAADTTSLFGEETSEAVWNKMVQDHEFRIWYGVNSSIMPALEQLQHEHYVSSEDLTNIVALSGVVPPDRAALVAKGLLAGFDGDFCVALHLLVPQLEHLVRVHLRNKGAKTTTTDASPLQMEAGLSTLVALPEMKAVFGEDLTFEIQALFCDSFGPNLRNEVAHGLLQPGAFFAEASIYAWWLFFHIIFLQYWDYAEQ